MALSLSLKHIFVFFPFWIAMKQNSYAKAFYIVLLPTILFLVSFVPYLEVTHFAGAVKDSYLENKSLNKSITQSSLKSLLEENLKKKSPAATGALKNVFFYKSFNNHPFYSLFVPPIVQLIISPFMFFVICILSTGFFVRRMQIYSSLLLYTAVIVVFSPAIANQYLAIPVAFTSINMNLFSFIYNLTGLVYLPLARSGGCRFSAFFYLFFVIMLFLSVLKAYKKEIIVFLKTFLKRFLY